MSEEQVDWWIPGRKGSRKPREMSLYVITEIGRDGPCKIGFTASVWKRKCFLNIGNWRLLEVRGEKLIKRQDGEEWLSYVSRVRGCEKAIHDQFPKKRIRGEWYDVPAAQALSALDGL